MKASPKQHQDQSWKEPRRLFPQPDTGDPDRQRATAPWRAHPACSQHFLQPCLHPSWNGLKNNWKFLVRADAQHSQFFIDKRAKENKISHCHLKIASAEIPRAVLSPSRDRRLIREGYQCTWCRIKPDLAARHSHSAGRVVGLWWMPEKL